MDVDTKYPVGAVVKILHEHEEEAWYARVTGHGEHTQNRHNSYPEEELGPRVHVSTNPIGMAPVEDSGIEGGRAASVKPSEIVRVLKVSES